MTKHKTKSKPIVRHPDGYRKFMSGFAGYARENNIHVHGGRGSFAKKAGEVWKDIKGKPAWKDNLDVILPPYLESEGATPISPIDRKQGIIKQFATEQFAWWNIKDLYGLWVQSINVYPENDRLFISLDEEDEITELSSDLDAFTLYNAYREMPENTDSSTASYLRFAQIDSNDTGGFDVTFLSQNAESAMTHIHSKTTFDWSQAVKEKYNLQKEAIGTKGVGRIASSRVSPRAAARQEAKGLKRPEDVKRAKTSIEKLNKLNKAVSDLDKQYANGVWTKTEYKGLLKKLYKY